MRKERGKEGRKRAKAKEEGGRWRRRDFGEGEESATIAMKGREGQESISVSPPSLAPPHPPAHKLTVIGHKLINLGQPQPLLGRAQNRLPNQRRITEIGPIGIMRALRPRSLLHGQSIRPNLDLCRLLLGRSFGRRGGSGEGLRREQTGREELSGDGSVRVDGAEIFVGEAGERVDAFGEGDSGHFGETSGERVDLCAVGGAAAAVASWSAGVGRTTGAGFFGPFAGIDVFVLVVLGGFRVGGGEVERVDVVLVGELGAEGSELCCCGSEGEVRAEERREGRDQLGSTQLVTALLALCKNSPH